MNIYKVKMHGYVVLPVKKEVKITAESAVSAEDIAQTEWFEEIYLEGGDFEGGVIETDSIEIVEEL